MTITHLRRCWKMKYGENYENKKESSVESGIAASKNNFSEECRGRHSEAKDETITCWNFRGRAPCTGGGVRPSQENMSEKKQKDSFAEKERNERKWSVVWSVTLNEQCFILRTVFSPPASGHFFWKPSVPSWPQSHHSFL